MTDSIIQKLYKLKHEDLSYFLCVTAFGKPNPSEKHPIERCEEAYKNALKLNTRMIVKTYDPQHKEVGEALILSKFDIETNEINEENTKYTISFYSMDAVVITPPSQNHFVDVRQLKLGEKLFVPDMEEIIFYNNKTYPIKFFSQSYDEIDFHQDAIQQDQKEIQSVYSRLLFSPTPFLGEEDSDLVSTPKVTFKCHNKQLKPLSLCYVKADLGNKETTVRFTSAGIDFFKPWTKDADYNQHVAILQINFLSLQKGDEVWLTGK